MRRFGMIALVAALSACSDPNQLTEDATTKAEASCADAQGWARTFSDDKGIATNATEQCALAAEQRRAYEKQERDLDERIKNASQRH